MATITNYVKRPFLVILIFTSVVFFVIMLKVVPDYADYKLKPLSLQLTQSLNFTTSITLNTTASSFTSTSGLPLCPVTPTDIGRPVQLDLGNVSFAALKQKYPAFSHWGQYKPRGCQSRVRLAILVPYRDRESHLLVLLNNLIPFLKKQQADFTIFVIEQLGLDIFNRGLLINAGFKQALSRDKHTCVVIHDVDLIPETSDNMYRCHENPLHLSTANAKYNYKLPYPSYSGGNIAITPDQFRRINGFSNWYFGWGGEDDDFEIRVKSVGMRLKRNPPKQGRYYAIKHDRDKLNPENPKKGKLFRSIRTRLRKEGLSSLHCNMTVTPKDLFTLVQVAIDTGFYNRTIKI